MNWSTKEKLKVVLDHYGYKLVPMRKNLWQAIRVPLTRVVKEGQGPMVQVTQDRWEWRKSDGSNVFGDSVDFKSEDAAWTAIAKFLRARPPEEQVEQDGLFRE